MIRKTLMGVMAGSALLQAATLADLQHIIVIYQENWSFDGLLGKYPGAANLDSASATAKSQLDSNGVAYTKLAQIDKRIPDTLSNQPWDFTRYIAKDSNTVDLVHRFYHEQWQINGGKMNRFAAGSDAKGFAMSYVDATPLPLGVLGSQGVVCDHFFHSAFGGSFLNHIWLVAAASPRWDMKTALPYSKVTKFDSLGNRLTDGFITPDSFAVNTVQPWAMPYSPGTADSVRLPLLDMPTIGDRLDGANVSWAWYSGGWDSAMAGKGTQASINFQFHHQPFNYFRKLNDTSTNGLAYRRAHLKDQASLLPDLHANLPSVVFVKFAGVDNEHPGYTNVVRGMNQAKALVDSIRADTAVWNHSAIVITYDEHGGRWDHVAPPVVDRWGPGARVPGVVLSPFAKNGTVDKTPYETVSILRLIEKRWKLQALGMRDSAANDLTNAFNFTGSTGVKVRQKLSGMNMHRVTGGWSVSFVAPDHADVLVRLFDLRGHCVSRQLVSNPQGGAMTVSLPEANAKGARILRIETDMGSMEDLVTSL